MALTQEQTRILAKLADTMLAEEADAIARNIAILSDPVVVEKNRQLELEKEANELKQKQVVVNVNTGTAFVI